MQSLSKYSEVNNRNPTEQMPVEIWVKIFSHSTPKTVLAASMACRGFHAIIKNETNDRLIFKPRVVEFVAEQISASGLFVSFDVGHALSERKPYRYSWAQYLINITNSDEALTRTFNLIGEDIDFVDGLIAEEKASNEWARKYERCGAVTSKISDSQATQYVPQAGQVVNFLQSGRDAHPWAAKIATGARGIYAAVVGLAALAQIAQPAAEYLQRRQEFRREQIRKTFASVGYEMPFEARLTPKPWLNHLEVNSEEASELRECMRRLDQAALTLRPEDLFFRNATLEQVGKTFEWTIRSHFQRHDPLLVAFGLGDWLEGEDGTICQGSLLAMASRASGEWVKSNRLTCLYYARLEYLCKQLGKCWNTWDAPGAQAALWGCLKDAELMRTLHTTAALDQIDYVLVSAELVPYLWETRELRDAMKQEFNSKLQRVLAGDVTDLHITSLPFARKTLSAQLLGETAPEAKSGDL